MKQLFLSTNSKRLHNFVSNISLCCRPSCIYMFLHLMHEILIVLLHCITTNKCFHHFVNLCDNRCFPSSALLDGVYWMNIEGKLHSECWWKENTDVGWGWGGGHSWRHTHTQISPPIMQGQYSVWHHRLLPSVNNASEHTKIPIRWDNNDDDGDDDNETERTLSRLQSQSQLWGWR